MTNVIPYHLRRPHILVVDDDFWVVDVLVDYINDIMGYEAHGVYSAEAAIHHLNEFGDIDLLITDIYMFGMNGLDLTEEIRKNWKTKVIVMSGIKYMAAGKEAIIAGAKEFFKKPISLEKFRQMIEVVLWPA
jgi:DNA-binding NtrC family response regulator